MRNGTISFIIRSLPFIQIQLCVVYCHTSASLVGDFSLCNLNSCTTETKEQQKKSSSISDYNVRRTVWTPFQSIQYNKIGLWIQFCYFVVLNGIVIILSYFHRIAIDTVSRTNCDRRVSHPFCLFEPFVVDCDLKIFFLERKSLRLGMNALSGQHIAVTEYVKGISYENIQCLVPHETILFDSNFFILLIYSNHIYTGTTWNLRSAVNSRLNS